MSEPKDTQPTVPADPGHGIEPACYEDGPRAQNMPGEETSARQATPTQAPPAAHEPAPEEDHRGAAGNVCRDTQQSALHGNDGTQTSQRLAGEQEGAARPTENTGGFPVNPLATHDAAATGHVASADSFEIRRAGVRHETRTKSSAASKTVSGAIVVALSLAAGFAGGTLATSRSGGSGAAGSTVTVVQHSNPVSAGVDWVADVANKVQPSVVGIQVSSLTGQTGSGSGVAFTPDGYILTNAHVVDDAEQINVRLNQGQSITAELIGSDPLYDIAVIRIPNEIPAAVFNTQTAAVGEPVAAFGSPLGLYGTVTVGIVSAVARPVTAGNRDGETSIISAVQTDAAINPGNSGGPLVNAGGEVIGVNSSIATLSGDRGGSIGLGFAIPAKTAVRVATELINNGAASRPLIGVTVGPADGGGARIETVTAGSPAEQAGLEPGDIVIAVDGRPVDNPVAAIALIRDSTPGQPLTVTLDRDGYELTVTVTTTSDAPQVTTTNTTPAVPQTSPTPTPTPTPTGGSPLPSFPVPSAPATSQSLGVLPSAPAPLPATPSVSPAPPQP